MTDLKPAFNEIIDFILSSCLVRSQNLFTGVEPSDRKAWYNRASAYTLLGAIDLACGDLAEAIRLNPEGAHRLNQKWDHSHGLRNLKVSASFAGRISCT